MMSWCDLDSIASWNDGAARVAQSEADALRQEAALWRRRAEVNDSMIEHYREASVGPLKRLFVNALAQQAATKFGFHVAAALAPYFRKLSVMPDFQVSSNGAPTALAPERTIRVELPAFRMDFRAFEDLMKI